MPSYLGAKWGSAALGVGATVTWSFAAANFTQLDQRYSGYKTFDSFIALTSQATVEKAVAAWEAVANIDFIEVSDSTSVNIRIGNAYIDGVSTAGGSTVAATQSWQLGSSLVAAEVYLDADAYLNSNLYEVVVHELGHALGLDHSSIASAVMYYAINSQNRSGLLSADDIAGIQHLYGPLAASLPPVSNLAVLQSAFENILRIDPGSSFALTPTIGSAANPAYAQAGGLAALALKVDTGLTTLDGAISTISGYADTTTSVATLAYQFFTGRTPTTAGLDYLVHSDANPNDLNDAYYARFNTENRYINFAVNLGKFGDGSQAFQSAYGALSLADSLKAAYVKIFGTTPTASKISAILDASVTLGAETMTRAGYFALYGQDGPNGVGTKAAAVGFLLVEAMKADAGPLVQANDHFLADLADGSALYNVDLTAIYANAIQNNVDALVLAPDGPMVDLVGAAPELGGDLFLT